MRIVIEIDEGSASGARISTDAPSAHDTADSGVFGAADLAALQLRGTNAGPAPARTGQTGMAADDPGAPPPATADGAHEGQTAGAAPNL